MLALILNLATYHRRSKSRYVDLIEGKQIRAHLSRRLTSTSTDCRRHLFMAPCLRLGFPCRSRTRSRYRYGIERASCLPTWARRDACSAPVYLASEEVKFSTSTVIMESADTKSFKAFKLLSFMDSPHALAKCNLQVYIWDASQVRKRTTN